MPPLTGPEMAKVERANADADKPAHWVTEQARHTPNLPLAPFAHCHTQPGAFRRVSAMHDLDLGWQCLPAITGTVIKIGQVHAAPPAIQSRLSGPTRHPDLVFFFVLVTWMCEQIGQLAVIGEQHQTLAIGVETTHWNQMPLDRHEVTHSLAASLVAHHSDYAFGFID